MQLSASKRITLVSEISSRLQMKEWHLIDLTLSQFGLPTTDEWQGGNKNSYVIDMAKGAKDNILIQ